MMDMLEWGVARLSYDCLEDIAIEVFDEKLSGLSLRLRRLWWTIQVELRVLCCRFVHQNAELSGPRDRTSLAGAVGRC
jgi:hypothetical protein